MLMPQGKDLNASYSGRNFITEALRYGTHCKASHIARPRVYCAVVIAVARRRRLEVHSCADDTQLYFHADPSADSNVQKLVT